MRCTCSIKSVCIWILKTKTTVSDSLFSLCCLSCVDMLFRLFGWLEIFFFIVGVHCAMCTRFASNPVECALFFSLVYLFGVVAAVNLYLLGIYDDHHQLRSFPFRSIHEYIYMLHMITINATARHINRICECVCLCKFDCMLILLLSFFVCFVYFILFFL